MTLGAVVADNVRRTQDLLRICGRSGLVSDRPDDIVFLVPARAFVYRVMAEGGGYETVLLPKAGPPVLITARAYVDYYRSVGVIARPSEDLAAALGELARGGTEPISAGSQLSKALRDALDAAVGSGRISEDDLLARCRRVKSPGEVALIRAAAAAADAGMAAAIGGATVGRPETEVAGAAERAMRGAGAESFAFSSIVSSGPELGVMREVTSTREIAPSDWVMIDLGCAVSGYNAEFARSLAIAPVAPAYADAYRAVHEAQSAAIGLIRPGAPIRAVDERAREVLERAGYGSVAYAHLTGHGIGTAVWEQPFVSAEIDDVFEIGMVVCVEPGVFIPGEGGIRIEDVVAVTDGGHERLTRTPTLPLASA